MFAPEVVERTADPVAGLVKEALTTARCRLRKVASSGQLAGPQRQLYLVSRVLLLRVQLEASALKILHDPSTFDDLIADRIAEDLHTTMHAPETEKSRVIVQWVAALRDINALRCGKVGRSQACAEPTRHFGVPHTLILMRRGDDRRRSTSVHRRRKVRRSRSTLDGPGISRRQRDNEQSHDDDERANTKATAVIHN